MTHTENAVSEQTVYDWANHYAVRLRHRLTADVRHVKMSGRPLNNLLLRGFKEATGFGRTAHDTFDGTLGLQIPHALAEAGTIFGPNPVRDLLPLPKLPGNVFVSGVIVSGVRRIGDGMLTELFGPSRYEKALGADATDTDVLKSLSLPVLLSRSHLANHVREATGGDRYEFPEDLFVAGESGDRAKMWLQGDLFDAQVIGRMVDGTGTGRYIKHQSGTTASNSSDHLRAIGEYSAAATDKINPLPTVHEGDPPQRPDHMWDLRNPGGRITSANQYSAGTENYRREQHAKEQGATLLIRMRGQFRLGAQKTSRTFSHDPEPVGAPVHSDPFTGDVYVLMFEAQYRTFLAEKAAGEQRARQRLEQRVDPEAWAGSATAPRIALTPLLTGAAGLHYTAGRAHHHLVRHLREQGRAGHPLLLTHGQSARIATYRAVQEWARDTVDAAVRAGADADGSVRRAIEARRQAPAGTAGDPDRALALLDGREQGRSLPPGTPIADLTRALDKEITRTVKEVNDVHALRPDNTAGAPAALPPEVALLAVDPVHLARDIAHELTSHVRLDVEQADGTIRSHWIDPSGRIHVFDPASGARTTLSAAEATQAGLWHDGVRDTAAAHGFDGSELAEFYNTSWSHQRTFEQAVLAEAAARLERMGAEHEALPSLFHRAVDASAALQPIVDWLTAEDARLTRGIATSQAEIDDLEAQLASLRLREQQILQGRQRQGGHPQPGRQSDQAELSQLTELIESLQGLGREPRARVGELTGEREPVTQELDGARLSLAIVDGLLADLRATGQGRPLTGRRSWTADEISTADEALRDSELERDERRTRPAYRARDVMNLPAGGLGGRPPQAAESASAPVLSGPPLPQSPGTSRPVPPATNGDRPPEANLGIDPFGGR
jgi:hypothetical protein